MGVSEGENGRGMMPAPSGAESKGHPRTGKQSRRSGLLRRGRTRVPGCGSLRRRRETGTPVRPAHSLRVTRLSGSPGRVWARLPPDGRLVNLTHGALDRRGQRLLIRASSRPSFRDACLWPVSADLARPASDPGRARHKQQQTPGSRGNARGRSPPPGRVVSVRGGDAPGTGRCDWDDRPRTPSFGPIRQPPRTTQRP